MAQAPDQQQDMTNVILAKMAILERLLIKLVKLVLLIARHAQQQENVKQNAWQDLLKRVMEVDAMHVLPIAMYALPQENVKHLANQDS